MERKRIKTELMIHDLKNPLAIIEAGIISLIEKEEKYGPVTEKQLNVLRRTLRNTRIARGLVNDILEVGRSAEGVFKKDRSVFNEFIKLPLIEIFDLTDHQTAEKIKESNDESTLKKILSDNDITLMKKKTINPAAIAATGFTARLKNSQIMFGPIARTICGFDLPSW